MPRILANLIAPLLPALIPLILLAACASTPAEEAREACEAAAKGDTRQALEAADKAYGQRDRLPLEDMCRLAASYAVVTLTTGDEQAAERFQTCYRASMDMDATAADAFYQTLDPQMAQGLAIISGLLDGTGIYTTTPVDTVAHSTAVEEAADIPAEAIAED